MTCSTADSGAPPAESEPQEVGSRKFYFYQIPPVMMHRKVRESLGPVVQPSHFTDGKVEAQRSAGSSILSSTPPTA